MLNHQEKPKCSLDVSLLIGKTQVDTQGTVFAGVRRPFKATQALDLNPSELLPL